MIDCKIVRATLLVTAALVVVLATDAHATGLRLNGKWVMTGDSSYDTFSSTDVRPSVDVSFSYSFLYLAKMLLVDVEGGYIHFTKQGDTLFDTYHTELVGHAMYLGLRLQFRYDRDYIEIIQPFVRADFGWSWSQAEIGNPSESLSAMHDWANAGFIYVGGGLQITVPTAFIRNKLRIRATKQFSIGFTYELGYYQPGTMKFRFRQPTTATTGAEPIPIDGMYAGSLDLRGLVHNFGLVVTF